MMINSSQGVRGVGRRPARLAALILTTLVASIPAWSFAADGAAPAAPAKAAASGKVKEVTVSSSAYATVIEAQVEGKIENYNSFKLNDPFRIVVDIWGVVKGEGAGEIPVSTPQVKAVRLTPQDGKLRLLVETPNDKPMPFLVAVEDGKLVLTVGGAGSDKVTSLDRGPETKGKASIVGIDVEDLPESTNVVVTTSGKVSHKTLKDKGLVTLQFPGAAIEKGLLRAIPAGVLGEVVRTVQPSVKKKVASVAISYDPAATPVVDTREDAVVVSFAKKGAAAKGAVVARVKDQAAPAAPPSVVEQSQAVALMDSPYAAGSKDCEWAFITGGDSAPGRKFCGQRISMDFKDADLQNVFRIIAEVSNLNIITTDEVKGKVTLRLVNVPWDQALALVLKSKLLGATREGNIVRVAPLATLRSEEKAELDAVKEKRKLETELSSETETIPVNFGKASELQEKLKSVLSEGTGKLQVDERTNMVIVRDVRKKIDEVKSLIEKLDTPIPQVLIEARIVEVDTLYTKELGVQWGGSWANQGKTQMGLSGIQNGAGTIIPGLPLSNITPFSTLTAPPSYAVNLPAAVGNGAGGGISFGILRDNLRLDLSLSALESAGKGKIVSSPKVVTIDNKEATIEQGTQIPYSTVSSSGTQTQFIDATLSLKVNPHITPDGSVMMSIEAKNDSQGEVGQDGKPAINKKKAVTNVLIRDGETAVIGGIIQATRNETLSEVPWFAKLPWVGWMFKNELASTRNRELLIFITPRILKADGTTARASTP